MAREPGLRDEQHKVQPRPRPQRDAAARRAALHRELHPARRQPEQHRAERDFKVALKVSPNWTTAEKHNNINTIQI